MERESFVFYASFLEGIEELPNESQLKVYQAVMNFAIRGIEPNNLLGIEKSIFALIKPQILANNKKYKDGCNGGRPKKEEKTNKKNHRLLNKKTSGYENKKPNVNENVNENVNDNVNENVNGNENDNEKDSKGKKQRNAKFQKPSKEEITDYALQEQLRTDIIEEFMDYYDSNGWRLKGGLPMKDWKATFRRWSRRQYDKPKNKSSGNPFLERLKKLEAQEKVVDVGEI